MMKGEPGRKGESKNSECSLFQPLEIKKAMPV